ncbi:MAG: 50S ribosomal protein L7/L12 [Candidatus Peribacteria bacterium]|nr:MAG: 50S ribosomal protein L7/L12 [Candidatus Peribacteria bacterium]
MTDETTNVTLSANAQKVLDLVKELSAVELNQLVKALEETFGVSAAAPMMVAGGAAGGDDAGGGSDTVTVELTEVGQQKIGVIKVVKDLLGLGLKEAKEIVEKAPTPVKEGVAMEEAESMKAKLEEAGATVTLK